MSLGLHLTWVSLFFKLSDIQIVAMTLIPTPFSCTSAFFNFLSSWMALAFERFLNWFKPRLLVTDFGGPTPRHFSDAFC